MIQFHFLINFVHKKRWNQKRQTREIDSNDSSHNQTSDRGNHNTISTGTIVCPNTNPIWRSSIPDGITYCKSGGSTDAQTHLDVSDPIAYPGNSRGLRVLQQSLLWRQCRGTIYSKFFCHVCTSPNTGTLFDSYTVQTRPFQNRRILLLQPINRRWSSRWRWRYQWQRVFLLCRKQLCRWQPNYLFEWWRHGELQWSSSIGPCGIEL